MLKNKKTFKNSLGFTLAELLIVITIILLLLPLALSNYNIGERQFSLQRSSHGLAQDLRDVQEMALTGQVTPLQFGQTFPAGGYGLYFEINKNSYVLFADCDGDGSYDSTGIASSCADASTDPGESYPEKIEEFSLEPGVMVSVLSPSSPLTITFLPPIPIITIKPQPAGNEAVITLNLEGKTETVTINTAGLIDVD